MNKAALFTSLMLLPFTAQAGVCTLFGGDGCANRNYYGYNTHKAHVEGIKYHRTGAFGYGISRGYPWYGDWTGYYPDYSDPKVYNAPAAVQPVFSFPAGNFYAPPRLDYFIEIRPIKPEPTSMIDIKASHAQVDYAPRMMRGSPMGQFRCVNNLCAPVYTPEQLQIISGQKRVFANPIEDGAVFESIYQIINERYIKPITIEELAVAGLSNLYEDVGVRVSETENSVSLTRNGIAIRTFPNKPYKEDVLGWSRLTYEIIDTLAHQSMKFGLQTHPEVFKKFFEGISVHLDKASKYIEPDAKRLNRIDNRRLDAMIYSIKHHDGGVTYENAKPLSIRVNEKKQVVLTIRKFEPNTPIAVKSMLSPYLQGLYDKKFAGLMIDLRDNNGGFVGSAIDTADLFLEKGKTIAMTRGRHRDADRLYEATNEDILKGAKIVVLVNGKTASAAELFAAALHDNDRAPIVGKKTYGKGTVQTSIAMDDGAEISFTWAYLYTPEGNLWDNIGIVPDAVLTCSDYSIEANASRLFDTVAVKKTTPAEKKDGEAKKDDAAKDKDADADKAKDDAETPADEVKNDETEVTVSDVKTDAKADETAGQGDTDAAKADAAKNATDKDAVKDEKPAEVKDDKNAADKDSAAKEAEITIKVKEPAVVEITEEDMKLDKKPDLTDKAVDDFNALLKKESEKVKNDVEVKPVPDAKPEAPAVSSKKAFDWFGFGGSSAKDKKKETVKSPSSPLDMLNGAKKADDKVKDAAKAADNTVNDAAAKVKDSAEAQVKSAADAVKNTDAKVKETTENAAKSAADAVKAANDKVKDTESKAKAVGDQVKAAEKAAKEVKTDAEKVKDAVKPATDDKKDDGILPLLF